MKIQYYLVHIGMTGTIKRFRMLSFSFCEMIEDIVRKNVNIL